MKKRSRVLFLPDYTITNPYQRLLQQSLEKFGYRIEPVHLRSLLKKAVLNLRRGDIAALHMHWPAESVVMRSGWTTFVNALMLTTGIFLVRIAKGRVVWTAHNLWA